MSGLIDFHVHSGPSLVPRHHSDHEIGALMRSAGITTFVLKAHEGSTAERAALLGNGAVGSIVLNSPVGGANPDAVEVAARLGARVAWMPTVSSEMHQQASSTPELEAHEGVSFATVPVTVDGKLLAAWHDVLDVVAEHDMILASGHIAVDEALVLFREARARGVRRLLVNHPLLPFLRWRDDHVDALLDVEAHIEVGVLADLLAGTEDCSATARLAKRYPASRLVFGSDLGHCMYPAVNPGITDWLKATEAVIGPRTLEAIVRSTGRELLAP